MNLSTKEAQRHTEQTCGCQQTCGWQRRRGLGAWDQQMQTIIYRMNKQPGPSVYSTVKYIQYLVINHNGKEYEKKMHIYE